MKGLITLAACAAAFALPAVAAASDAHTTRALAYTDAAAPAATHDAWSDARQAKKSQARMFFRADRKTAMFRADRKTAMFRADHKNAMFRADHKTKSLRAARASKALLAHRLLRMW